MSAYLNTFKIDYNASMIEYKDFEEAVYNGHK